MTDKAKPTRQPRQPKQTEQPKPEEKANVKKLPNGLTVIYN